MHIELVTKSDLESFKRELIEELKTMLAGKPQQVSKRYLRSRDVKAMLNISAGTLLSLRVKGHLHPTKVGSLYFYPIEEVEALLNGNGQVG